MSKKACIMIAIVAGSVIGCANQGAKTAKTQDSPAPQNTAKSGSKFSKVQLGMTINQVNAAIGLPNETDSHESGKRWIPFYFGNDARRLEALYKDEGCLVFASGNAWGANAEGELKEIKVDPSGACFGR